MKFKIYYDDGQIYCADPFEAKPNGVICVAVEGRPLWHSRDYYCWRKDMNWVPMDLWGFNDYMLNYIGAKNVLFGRNVRDDLYWEIVKRATAESIG